MSRALLLLATLLLASCASQSLPERLSAEATGHSLRTSSIVSSWVSAGGSRTSRPPGGRQQETVSAAWWGWDTTDATHALQAALDSGAAVVMVPRMPTPWIISCTLKIRSRQQILIEPGTLIVAAAGAFRDSGECLMEADAASDFSLVGYGATLRMRKEDYARPPYDPGQWRHAISLRGAFRARIAGLSIESSGGDGVYVGTSAHAPCEDLVLKDLTITDHYRQGISVISARRLLIEDCRIARTYGAQPAAGIDFEPNSDDPGFEDCVVRRCVIEGNRGAGIQFALARLPAGSAPVTVRIEDCVIRNLPLAAVLHGADPGLQGTLEFSRTSFVGLTFLRSSGAFSVRVSP